MARISGPDLKKHGFIARNFVRFVYRMTRRKLGKVVAPVQIMAHHPRQLQGYGMMEQAQMKSHLVDASLKELAQLRVATRVGCPF
jgi:alkylhydroperoxidase family enzyme